MSENTPIPVTVLRGMPDADAADIDRVAVAVAAALGAVAAEQSAAGRYADPRGALRRHPRGAWGVPGADSRWQTAFSPAGFRG